MHIIVNGEPKQTKAETLPALLEEFSLDPKTVVVEINGKIVDRSLVPTTSLAENDTLEIVHFVGGG
ncbi:MAG: sulfur carrier protein ThiS [Desulfovibrio sp.]|nr:sulfur carrier protein ThiS [Desulfovibrio sp.]